jgi:hypothetical protein
MGICIDKDDIIIEKKNKLIQYELKSENMEKSFSYNEESNQNFESKHLERIVKTKRKNNSGPILKFLMEKNNNINS